jgi:hypothetical protein
MATNQSTKVNESWVEIEENSLHAFDRYANESAPGLAATLKRAVHYAFVDRESNEIVIDKRAFFFGFMSYGLQGKAPTPFGNSATWIADSIAKRVGPTLRSTVEAGITKTDDVINTYHSRGLKVVASRSMTDVAAAATQYARRTVRRSLADLRHFFAAFIESPSSARDIASVGWTPTTNDIKQLQRELYERIRQNPEDGEDLIAWGVILHIDESPHEGGPPGPSQKSPASRRTR